MYDATTGYDGDPKLLTALPSRVPGRSRCRWPDHRGTDRLLLPLRASRAALPRPGHWVGYIAHEHIIGISKLTRLVRLYARRFAVQERVGQQIADALEGMLEPHGVAVYLEAHHMCMQMRGVQEPASLTRTTFWRGEYDGNPALRSEFLAACGLHRQAY